MGQVSSWCFWVIYLLNLRNFPVGRNVLPPFRVSCVFLRSFKCICVCVSVCVCTRIRKWEVERGTRGREGERDREKEKKVILSIICLWIICMQVIMEARRGCWILWNWSYRQFLVAMWVLETKFNLLQEQ